MEQTETAASRPPLLNVRPACVAALGMGIGVLLAEFFPAERVLAAAAVLLSGGAALVFIRKRVIALLFLFAALGTARMGTDALPPAPEGAFTLSGRVCEQAAYSDTGWTALLDSATLDGAPLTGRVLLTADFIIEPVYGQRVTMEAVLTRPSAYRAAYWQYLGVCALAEGEAETLTITAPKQDGYGRLLALRKAVYERIQALFPETGGVAAAMLLGDKRGMDEGEYARFTAVGAAHLFAVSGLHVSVLAGALLLALRAARPWPRFLVLAAFLTFYALLTALSPSVMRASVMLLCGALARPLRRRPDGPSALAAAFVAVLLYRPAALLQAGFQLSFSAVYGLLLLASPLQRAWRRLGSALSGVLSASVAVSAATLPVSARTFEEIRPISLAANVLLLPLVPFFFVPAFFCTALSFAFPRAAAALAALPDASLRLILAVVGWGGDAALSFPAPKGLACLLYYAALLCSSPLCLRPKKTRLALCGALLFCAALAWI